jgi:dihydroflavonol-4-reductase
MKVFVTGATGFIGSHLVPRLLRDGHELRCLVRRPGAGRALEGQGAATVTGDVTDRGSIERALPGCDCLLHLANVYSFWERDRRLYAKVNVEGTRNVMECALAASIPRVVHVSSVVIYGRPADSPFTEESPLGPVRFSEYARTKHAGDRIAWELHERRGLPLVTILPGAVLGPGDTKPTGDYLRSLVRRHMPARVMEDSVLTFVHVRDVAEAIARVAARDDLSGARYLLGAERMRLRDVNRMVSRISGVPLPVLRMPGPMATAGAALLTWLADRIGQPPPWGMSRDQIRTMREGFAFDGSKAERELGFAYTPVRAAVQEMIAAIRAAAGGD